MLTSEQVNELLTELGSRQKQIANINRAEFGVRDAVFDAIQEIGVDCLQGAINLIYKKLAENNTEQSK